MMEGKVSGYPFDRWGKLRKRKLEMLQMIFAPNLTDSKRQSLFWNLELFRPNSKLLFTTFYIISRGRGFLYLILWKLVELCFSRVSLRVTSLFWYEPSHY